MIFATFLPLPCSPSCHASKYSVGALFIHSVQLAADRILSPSRIFCLTAWASLFRPCFRYQPSNPRRSSIVLPFVKPYVPSDPLAIDNLVIYALVKQKSSNNLEQEKVYWIHPLVRHWVQDADLHGKSMTLQTDKASLQKLRTRGSL
ncbi:hypothetical protein B0H67DRAFT_389195 [Lasiosphaeris hirsuta]|uniref:Uncharacterized protein n=1 Tax=Lasiosphaeris hirsuta TaxID=260670 RepID=A0AA40DLX6_9PEZI|nr:hypothetical protein B0H67DRAFT_389195 [Lasiosphaeris hirsuta]